jgi:WD40 repeat protein
MTNFSCSRALLVAATLSGLVLAAPGAIAQDLFGSTGGGGADPGSILAVDASDGTSVVLDSPFGGSGLAGIAFAPDGRLFAVSSVDNPEDTNTAHLLEINPATGGLISDLGPMLDSGGNGCAFMDLSFQPGTGTLFAITSNQSDVGVRCGIGGSTGGHLATVNLTTGEYTIIGRDASFGNSAGGLAFAPDGTLYFTPMWDGNGTLYTLDPGTAEILDSVALSSENDYAGMAWHPSENTLYASFNFSQEILVRIDPATGTVTEVGETQDRRIMGIDFQGAPQPQQPALAVPAMSWLGLLALALLLAAFSLVILRQQGRV